jgi:serine/threonine protein kinase
MIVMQYANNGNLLSFLNRNINKLTWMMKLVCLYRLANSLVQIHSSNLVHCNLHGGNIVLHKSDATRFIGTAFICDFGLSHPIRSESDSNIQGTLPYIAPEVFSTCKFTKASDIYSFGIIMYLVATGEPPFKDRLFDKDLACDIADGLRPTMPDSAPEEYKKLAEKCCDADPSKRPENILEIRDKILLIISVKRAHNDESDNNIWDTIYHNDINV